LSRSRRRRCARCARARREAGHHRRAGGVRQPEIVGDAANRDAGPKRRIGHEPSHLAGDADAFSKGHPRGGHTPGRDNSLATVTPPDASETAREPHKMGRSGGGRTHVFRAAPVQRVSATSSLGVYSFASATFRNLLFSPVGVSSAGAVSAQLGRGCFVGELLAGDAGYVVPALDQSPRLEAA
jgi:hypothetical protein